MTDNNNKLPNIFENGGLVAIYDLKLEQEEPSQPEDLSFTNLSKRNLEKTTVGNSEKTRPTKRPKPHYHCSTFTLSTSVFTTLEIHHMRSHSEMNSKFKCPCSDCSSGLKSVVDHLCSRFHDKPMSSKVSVKYHPQLCIRIKLLKYYL